MEEQHKYLTWEQFDSVCKEIHIWAKDKKFNSIYGPPRGGLVLAVKLSHLLEIPLIVSKDDITPRTLIVDDITDTGKTMEKFRQKGNKIATIFYHKQSTVIPDKWFFEKTDKWVIYPWENSENINS